MISLKVKKRLNRIIAGIVSAAMTLTMVPDVWLPVYADSVRNEIVNEDVAGQNNDADKANACFYSSFDTENDHDASAVCMRSAVPFTVSESAESCRISSYTVFSASQTEDLTLNGWKSNFTGGIYSGRNFVCNLSEFYLDGRADAAGNVTANGWKINIPEKNENVESIAMPDLEESILAKAGEYTYYSESPSFIQDTNIINGSIMVSGDVTISGTNFEGDCYIIADRDITYNVNSLNTTGRLVLYSRNGNITVNGTNININGIMYAPKGKVSFNANETTINGRIWADTVNFSGSIFNITGSDSDLELIENTEKDMSGPEIIHDIPDTVNSGDSSEIHISAVDESGVKKITVILFRCSALHTLQICLKNIAE